MTTTRRPFLVFALPVVLTLWTLWGGYSVIYDIHSCRILQTVPATVDATPPPPQTDAEIAAKTAACNRPTYIALAVWVIGYIVIAAVTVGFFVDRRRESERPRSGTET